MAVKRGGSSNSVVLAAIVMTIVTCVIIGGLGLYLVNPGDMFHKRSNENSQSEEPITELPKTTTDANGNEVDFQEALNSSTTLVFGDKNSPNVVTLIADPEDMSRETRFIDGRPSEFLQLVQKGDIRLNLLLKPSKPERETGVESLQKAATCRYYSDNSVTAIYTLNGIVAAGANMNGSENVDQARILMGMEDIPCPADSETNAIINIQNAKAFSTLLHAEDKPILIAGGGITTNIHELDDKWQEGLKLGMNIRNFDPGASEHDGSLSSSAMGGSATNGSPETKTSPH